MTSQVADIAPDRGSSREMVLVTGSGRSGTSTVAGTLKLLGYHVPQPEVKPNSSNPRGFFEPKWAVGFHKRALDQAGVRTLDARPEAAALAAKSAAKHPELREQVQEWLEAQLDFGRIVVKDPRAFWMRDVWVGACEALHGTPKFLTMLRHPAEVVGSRDMHYVTVTSRSERRARETANLAGWVNVALSSEAASRGCLRAFAPYGALIEDWRAVMGRIAEQLQLTYDTALVAGEHHPVDDFVDAGLRRSQLGWDDLAVAPALAEVGERTWQAMLALVADPDGREAIDRLGELREDYAELHDEAVAFALHHTQATAESAAAKARRKAESAREEAAVRKAGRPAPAPAAGRTSRVRGELARVTRGALRRSRSAVSAVRSRARS